MFVCPHRTTLFPLDGFPRNLIFEYVSYICRENSNFINATRITVTVHEDLYIVMIIYPGILGRMINFSNKSCGEAKHCLHSVILFFENRAFCEIIMEK